MHITLPSVRADWRIPSSILPTSPTTILWELNFSIWELKQQTQNSQNELIIPADISARKIRMMKVRESTAGLGIASVSCSAWRLRWWGGLGGGRESSFIVDNGCWKKKNQWEILELSTGDIIALQSNSDVHYPTSTKSTALASIASKSFTAPPPKGQGMGLVEIKRRNKRPVPWMQPSDSFSLAWHYSEDSMKLALWGFM